MLQNYPALTINGPLSHQPIGSIASIFAPAQLFINSIDLIYLQFF